MLAQGDKLSSNFTGLVNVIKGGQDQQQRINEGILATQQQKTRVLERQLELQRLAQTAKFLTDQGADLGEEERKELARKLAAKYAADL